MALETIRLGDWRPRCAGCGKPIHSTRQVRCRPCASQHIRDAATARYAAAGTPRPHCAVCDKVVDHGSKHCPQCVAKIRSQRGLHKRFRQPCVDCGGRVSAAACKRCGPCEKKRRSLVAAARTRVGGAPCLDCAGPTSAPGVKRCHRCAFKRRSTTPQCLGCATPIGFGSKHCKPCSNKRRSAARNQPAADALPLWAVSLVRDLEEPTQVELDAFERRQA
jgi:hypothetical protein